MSCRDTEGKFRMTARKLEKAYKTVGGLGVHFRVPCMFLAVFDKHYSERLFLELCGQMVSRIPNAASKFETGAILSLPKH